MKNPFTSWSIYVSTVTGVWTKAGSGGLLHGMHALERGLIGSFTGALIRLEPLGLDEGSPIFDLVLQPRLQHHSGSEFRFDVECSQALANGG